MHILFVYIMCVLMHIIIVYKLILSLTLFLYIYIYNYIYIYIYIYVCVYIYIYIYICIYIYIYIYRACSQDFGGEGAQIWVPVPKRDPGCHSRKYFEKRACNLVPYITSVAQKSLI